MKRDMKTLCLFLFAVVVMPAAEKVSESSSTAPKGFAVSYVKSDRKWKYGFRKEPYDKISENFQKALTESLGEIGFHRLPMLVDTACCQINFELIEVTTHPAAFKKPGMDAAATVTILDASKRILYTKGYRGESRTMMNTYGHLINHAIEAMAKAVAADEQFVSILATGRSKSE